MRVFLIVLDSVGIGELPDAAKYGDEGSNTLHTCFLQSGFSVPNLKKAGLWNIDGTNYAESKKNPAGAFGRLAEKSAGKDTTTGHWEICGIVSEKPMPTYPNGFPDEIISEFSRRIGRAVLCNIPYSGTQVINDYGEKHMKTGALIVYTSADSVFQIAAHESVVPPEELYEYCRTARDILVGEHAVGRVIARPFEGAPGSFRRTSGRHDFSVAPPKKTLLDYLSESGVRILPIGKIYDIFAGHGLSEAVPTASNAEGMEKTLEAAKSDFQGLCFTNLVDFDMVFGHRNDAAGYAKALMEFDAWLPKLQKELKPDDIVMITADHGCDPGTKSTDHSREYVPLLVLGEKIRPVSLGTRGTFSDIGKTVADMFGVDCPIEGESFFEKIVSAGWKRSFRE